MANSDIIKIGFDYRASLAQFEKETNGVFDGISNKAGKQKITIQLDAKDDKVIDKIKELQKLKLDKFTFEFGNSGLKEQLQTFDKLENKINEIISLSKGIDLSFNTKNKTDAYNQLKKYADAFKDYYGNEEAMATNAGAKAGYAYYKAYEEALRKGVAQSKLEKVTIDFDVNDSFFSKERIVGNRIKEFENFQKYGNADESNLIAEIISLENRLLKFNSAYSQVKANLGDAPITPEITKNIEEYVRLLEVAESRAKDAELFGYSSEDINSDKDLANMYLDFAKEDATAENKKYIESLKQEETQAIATAEAEQKLAEAQKETVFNTSNSNDSQIEELKSNIQEVKTELGDVKDRISSIESNGFENVRDDVEKTKESVKELNSELAEMKSNLSSTPQESNISSGMKDAFPNTDTKLDEAVTSAKDLDKTLEQVDIPTDSFDKVLEKLDRTKSELVDIVKITKQSVSDADGKFHDSYTLKDSRGSTEIYGVNSKTDKGQILRQNIVGYDKKKDELDISKAQLEVDKQLAKEEDNLAKVQQKKAQAFLKEQANYEESVNKVNSAIQKTDEILDTLPLHDKLDGQFLDMIDSVDNLNSKLKSGEFTLSEYKNEVKSVTSEYSKMVSIQQKRDVEDYKANAKANLENAKNIKAEWDKNLKAIQDYMDAVTKLNNLKAKDKGTGSEANQIALQTQNVEELKQAAWDARKNLSSMQAENPDIIAWKQWVDMMELFDQASKGSAESAAKLKDALNNIKVPSLDKYENKLSSYLNKTGGYDATIKRFEDGGWTSNTYLENVQAVKNAVKQYATLLDNIKTNQNGIATDEDIQNLDKYEKKIKDTIATVTNMSAAEKGYNFVSGQKELDKIHKLLAENSKMSSEAKAKIKAYYAEIESGNPSMSLDKIHGEILKIYNAEVEAGRAGRTLWDTLKNSGFHQIAAQMAGMVGVYDVINIIKQTASTVTELNTQITELAKVSEQSSSQIYADFDSYANIAKEVRGTISDTIAATADWSKNGYSIPDAKQLAEISQLYKNVGDGIDIDAANESLISTLKGFQLEADQAEHIVDVFNEVSNNEAISSGGIGEALQRSAASFNAASTSLEKSVSLVTATNSVLQNPEKVGNMWRTVSARLRGKFVPIYSENYSLCTC